MSIENKLFKILLIGFICVIIALSLCYTPQNRKYYIENDKDVILEQSTEKIINNYGNTDDNGDYLYNYIRLPLEGNVQYIEIQFSKDFNQLYFVPSLSYIEDYSAMVDVLSIVDLENDKAIVSCTDATGFFIRLSDIDNINLIRMHSNKPKYEYKKISFNLKSFVIMLAGIILLLILLYRFEPFTTKKEIKCEGLKRNNNLVSVLVPIISIPISYFLNIVLIKLYGNEDSIKALNWRTWLTVTVFIYLVIWLITNRNNLYSNIEKIFFIMSLSIGGVMILCGPFGHDGWDVDTHYRYALIDSYMGQANYTQTDMDIITAQYTTLVKDKKTDNIKNIDDLNNSYSEVITSQSSSMSLPHLPAGIGMALARFFRLPFYFVYIIGKFFNLLFYTTITYFALKHLKHSRLLLMLIALIPTNIFMASCIDYDAWIISLSFLAMAIMLGVCQRENDVISWKEVIVMVAAFALACLPKQLYLPMMLIPFFMPKKKLPKRKWLYYSIIILSIIMLLISLMLRSQTEFDKGGDMRGGTNIDASKQLHYILGHKTSFLVLLLDFVPSYMSFANMELTVTNFGNMGSISFGANIIIALILITMAIDRYSVYSKKYNWILSIYTVLLYIGEAVLISVAFYLIYTTVGGEQIIGTQARYLLPFVYPVLSVILPGSKNQIDFNKLAVSELVILCCIYMYVITRVFEVRMII